MSQFIKLLGTALIVTLVIFMEILACFVFGDAWVLLVILVPVRAHTSRNRPAPAKSPLSYRAPPDRADRADAGAAAARAMLRGRR